LSLTVVDLTELVPSWTLHLRAERKTEGTIKTYLAGVGPFLTWCGVTDRDPLERLTLQTWTTELLEGGSSAATAKTRMMAVRHFTRWLAAEGEIPDDPFVRLKAPKVDEPVVPVLTEDQLRALVKACAAPADEASGLPSLRHRRDEAIVRLLAETGLRAGECVALHVEDVDLVEMVAVVRRGKGGKGRKVPFGATTAKAIDRYKRVRRLHKLSDRPELWLGDRGRLLAYNGLYWALGQRAAAAGIKGFHPHMLRHTSADRWLAAGGSETGAMAVHGWSSPEMLQRYGRANREQRAIEEARRLDRGEL
jgi:site-specific recombinase XerD